MIIKREMRVWEEILFERQEYWKQLDETGERVYFLSAVFGTFAVKSTKHIDELE